MFVCERATGEAHECAMRHAARERDYHAPQQSSAKRATRDDAMKQFRDAMMMAASLMMPYATVFCRLRCRRQAIDADAACRHAATPPLMLLPAPAPAYAAATISPLPIRRSAA